MQGRLVCRCPHFLVRCFQFSFQGSYFPLVALISCALFARLRLLQLQADLRVAKVPFHAAWWQEVTWAPILVWAEWCGGRSV